MLMKVIYFKGIDKNRKCIMRSDVIVIIGLDNGAVQLITINGERITVFSGDLSSVTMEVINEK